MPLKIVPLFCPKCNNIMNYKLIDDRDESLKREIYYYRCTKCGGIKVVPI